MKVPEFVGAMRHKSLSPEFYATAKREDYEKLIAIIERQRAALRRIDVGDCDCGVPCDCYSWKALAKIAREELDREV